MVASSYAHLDGIQDHWKLIRPRLMRNLASQGLENPKKIFYHIIIIEFIIEFILVSIVLFLTPKNHPRLYPGFYRTICLLLKIILEFILENIIPCLHS